MIVHVVLFRPRTDISEADRKDMYAALETAAREIPTVRRFHIGERLRVGAAYEPLMQEDFPFFAIIEFDDRGGLKAYLEHPQHTALGQLFYRLQDAALVYDYEVEPLKYDGRQ